MRAEQPQARLPDISGEAVRGDVSLHYDVYGDGPTTVLLLPCWSIVPSRVWKAQVPFLSRHVTVITFDGRGTGASSRPRGPEAFADTEFADDALAVLDATGTDRAVVVGFSAGATWAVHLATAHPERVLGLFAISPACGLDVAPHEQQLQHWSRRVDDPQGWDRFTRDYWLSGGLDGFREFYFAEMFSEPHSTKQIEDVTRWSADIDAQTLVDSTAGRLGVGASGKSVERLAPTISCPVHVVHGGDDRVRSPRIGERLAELTGAALTVVEGAGHGLPARDPVLVNTLLLEFVQSVTGLPPRRTTWTRAMRRRRRVLYLSSAIGLGHARRDLAIASELRRVRDDIEIDWLTQHPVTRLLEDAGERVHPASRHLLAESHHVEAEAGEHDLHAFEAVRRMDEIMVANFMLFNEVVADEPPDLVIADEAWEVDYFLHENPELKRWTFAWLTDFVGWLPMPDGGEREAALAADYNAEMIEHRARFPRLRDRSIFVGNPDDVVPASFGAGLPDIRDWMRENFDYSGYVTPEPTSSAQLGLDPDERLCVVTVGGTGVGDALLRRVLDAVPLARKAVPELRFLVVTGPRIDPASLPRLAGVEVRGFVPDLPSYLSACDVAVVQGGLSTCMELTAAGTPFIYVPLEHHFEQNFHVRHRLERYGAGQLIRYSDACDPDRMAAAIIGQLTTAPAFLPVETDGAARAAAMLAELL